MSLMPYLYSRIFSSPLMIARSRLDLILDVLAPRLQGEPFPVWQRQEIDDELEIVGGVAVISVLNTLVRRTGGLQSASGLMSYASIATELQTAIEDNAVKAILLNFDSPGGEAGGVFDLADRIYAARQIKPVWAVANEEALSAAYALAASSERIYVPRTGVLGSIGVIAMHLDQSRADAKEGLKYTPIFAGARKNDYSPHEPLADPARASLQAEVDRVYRMFVECVARGRGLSVEAIRKTEAAVFFAHDSIAVGLADKIGTFEDAMSDLGAYLSSPSYTLNRKATIMTKPETHPQIETNNDLPDLETLKAEFIEKTKADARAEAMAYVAEVFDLCAIAGVPDKAKDFVAKSVPSAEVRHALLEAKAKEADATAIAGQAPDNAVASVENKIDTAAIYQARNNK